MIAKLVLQALAFAIVMAAVLLVGAGTAYWPGAIVFLAAMQGGGLVMSLWLALKSPDLLEDRMRSLGQKKTVADRILLPLMHGFFFVWIAAMALDARRHGTAQMPLWLNLLAGAAIVGGFLATVRVFRENRFATAIIKVQEGHKVIDTGPYALVRHPLYGIAIVTYLAIPFALGSWAGLLGVPVLAALAFIRALAEERMLKKELDGYCDYVAKVRHRFVPYVW